MTKGEVLYLLDCRGYTTHHDLNVLKKRIEDLEKKVNELHEQPRYSQAKFREIPD